MSSDYLAAVKARRTYYSLKKESPIDDSKIQEIISQAILDAPSAFNSQSSRVIILLKDEHDKLWDIAKSALKAVVPADQYPATEKKLSNFQGAYGTVLFFVARSIVKGMQDKYALYADKFPVWATHSDGMAQHIIWTALETEGLGANLQHYNPLIDAGIQKAWNVPEDWEHSAQLVFGTPTRPAGDKQFGELSERLKVYGA
ncbi:hypothetical protein V501_04789 [Pseudogymnoascus sp. VKM F-4519 (FW-2642)]|nr:hypothetical protein V501_04789 [Pseudogymnoascus sp. VKM F-4519 (FW-2642)]